MRLNHDVPPKLEDIINKALEKDRNLRYQHASEMRSDLQRLKRDTDTGRSAAQSAIAPPDSGSGTKHSSSDFRKAYVSGAVVASQPRNLRMIVAAVIAAIAIAAIGAYFWRSRNPSAPAASAANPTTVAVLPFQNMGPDKISRLSSPRPARRNRNRAKLRALFVHPAIRHHQQVRRPKR